jgi:hypothetical protein
MSENKKTSSDYLREYREKQNAVKRAENEITERLLFLSQQFPDAPIQYLTVSRDEFYRAKSLNSKFYIDTLAVETRIQYMEMIEKYISEQERVVQLELFKD